MKSNLAKARDKWLLSDNGKECCEGQTSGQYLQNRLEKAFIAGYNAVEEQIKELEAENKKLREILRREIDDGRAEVDDIGVEAWIEQALKGE